MGRSMLAVKTGRAVRTQHASPFTRTLAHVPTSIITHLDDAEAAEDIFTTTKGVPKDTDFLDSHDAISLRNSTRSRRTKDSKNPRTNINGRKPMQREM